MGAELFTQYTLGSGFYIDGRVRKSVVGNFDKVLRQSNSVLPHVRSDHDIYARDGDPGIDQLTITKVNKIMPSVYGKLTAGYLEKMFAGVSGEILWKPISSSLGIGIELSQVQQRNFDMLLGSTRLSSHNRSLVGLLLFQKRIYDPIGCRAIFGR